MLKAKIVGGCLMVKRGGEFENQYCPRTKGGRACSHMCPLFGEVEVSYDVFTEGINTVLKENGRHVLTICENKTFEVVE